MEKLPALRKIFSKNPDGSAFFNLSRGFILRLSRPMAAALALVLACAVGWAFFMGYMVGKGQNPETRIQSMTGGLLQPGEKNSRQAETAPMAAEAGTAGPETAEGESQPQAGEERPAAADTARAAAANATYPFSGPSGQELAAWGAPREHGARERAASAPGQGKAPVKKAEKRARKARDNRPLYDYSYQAAAFKNARDAENLKAALKAKGLSCSTRKSGKVYLVVVAMRGTQADAESLRQKLRAQKLGRPLLLSKKPVAGKAPKSR